MKSSYAFAQLETCAAALVRVSRTTDFKLYAMAGLNRKIKTRK
jgi:hypothetical protein